MMFEVSRIRQNYTSQTCSEYIKSALESHIFMLVGSFSVIFRLNGMDTDLAAEFALNLFLAEDEEQDSSEEELPRK